jgi:hypothetical protein
MNSDKTARVALLYTKIEKFPSPRYFQNNTVEKASLKPKNESSTLAAAVSNTRVSGATAVYDLMHDEIQLSASFVQE